MIIPKISAGIGRLYDHRLAGDRTAGEGQLVAGAAPSALAIPGDIDGGKTVRQVIADSPWALVRAGIGRASVAARRGVGVGEWLVIDVAGHDGAGDCGLSWPGTRGFATVPVPSRDTRAGLSSAEGG